MNFSKMIPTRPGDYAWRLNARSGHGLVEVIDTNPGLWCLSTLGDTGCAPNERGGEWCRLVPAEEIEKAWSEARETKSEETTAIGDDTQSWAVLSKVTWDESRAKRVMEGDV